MSRWWRAYDEAVDDPKLQQLPAVLFRAWFNLCCLTSQNGGAFPTIGVIAFKLRCSEDKACETINKLEEAGLIDRDNDLAAPLSPHNWKGRQFQSDTSTPRVKRFREQRRNVSVTPPETEADTEPEAERKGRDARKRACSWPFDEFWEAFPNKVGRKSALKSFEKVEKAKAIEFPFLMAALANYVNKTDDRPWCNPTTWLNQGRWDDKPAEVPNGQNRQNGGRINPFKATLDGLQRGFELEASGNDEACPPPPRLLSDGRRQ